MQCQYSHLGIGKTINVKLSSMKCIQCGKKVPRRTVIAIYRGHKEVLAQDFNDTPNEEVVAADWFVMDAKSEMQCRCGLQIHNMFIACKGDWYKSFFENTEVVEIPVSGSTNTTP